MSDQENGIREERKRKRPSQSEIVAKKLMDSIVSGEFETGSKLPSEKVLSEYFQVSRVTLRQAFKMLEEQGAIKARQGSGTYVMYDRKNTSEGETASSDKDVLSGAFTFNVNNFQVTQYLDARRAVELAAIDLALVTMDNDNLYRLNEIVAEQYNPDCVGEKYAELDCRFHREIFRASKNEFLMRFWEILEPCLREQIMRILHEKESFDHSKEMHRQIFEALLQRDKKKVHELMDAHYGTILGRFFIQAGRKGKQE